MHRCCAVCGLSYRLIHLKFVPGKLLVTIQKPAPAFPPVKCPHFSLLDKSPPVLETFSQMCGPFSHFLSCVIGDDVTSLLRIRFSSSPWTLLREQHRPPSCVIWLCSDLRVGSSWSGTCLIAWLLWSPHASQRRHLVVGLQTFLLNRAEFLLNWSSLIKEKGNGSAASSKPHIPEKSWPLHSVGSETNSLGDVILLDTCLQHLSGHVCLPLQSPTGEI